MYSQKVDRGVGTGQSLCEPVLFSQGHGGAASSGEIIVSSFFGGGITGTTGVVDPHPHPPPPHPPPPFEGGVTKGVAIRIEFTHGVTGEENAHEVTTTDAVFVPTEVYDTVCEEALLVNPSLSVQL